MQDRPSPVTLQTSLRRIPRVCTEAGVEDETSSHHLLRFILDFLGSIGPSLASNIAQRSAVSTPEMSRISAQRPLLVSVRSAQRFF